MKVTIQIATETFVRFWLVLAGFALAVYTIYNSLTGLIIVGSAFFIAVALYVPVNRLARRLPGKSRPLATLAAFVAIILILSAILFLAVPPILQQTSKLLTTLPSLVATVSERSQFLSELVQEYNIEAQMQETLASMQSDLTRWAAGLGTNIISSIGGLLSALAQIFLVLVIAFLMLVEGPVWTKRVWGLYHDKEKLARSQKVALQMQAVVSGYVNGQLTVSGIGALVAGGAVFVISMIFPFVPSNLALPTIAITFVLSLIPMFGATLAGITVFLLIAIGNFPAAIIYAIFFTLYQQIENNFIAPVIQSKKNDLSPLEVIVSVTIGLYLFGLAGGIISIPIAGCIKVLLEDYLEHRHSNSKAKQKTPVHHAIANKLKRSGKSSQA